jgi:Protein of unknown function (DUF1552)
MSKPSWYISRRTVLQTAGTAVALPVLEAMVAPRSARAAPTVPPRRFLGIHALCFGYVGRNDADLKTLVAPWTSQAQGPSVPLENNSYLRPFFDRKIESKVTVLTGITDRVLIGTHDSPVKLLANTYPVAMYRGGCVVLTATPGPNNTVGPPPQPDPFQGATADQIAAFHLGKFTKIPSLSLAVATIGGNPAFTMSNKSASNPVPSDKDPKTVFDRLFAGTDPQATLEEIQRRARYRKSVLDGVRSESARLSVRLGRSDRQKLDQYLDSVRSLEKRIVEAGTVIPPGTMPPGTRDSYRNTEALQLAMQDLIVQAFITDSTRVVAFAGQYPDTFLKFRTDAQKSLDYSQFRSFSGTALSGDHHSMSHYDQGLDSSPPSAEVTAYKKDWMEIYTHWTLDMYANLLAKLDNHMDVDGKSTILDNTVALWGGDDSDSATHAYLSMPCILGGRGGSTDAGWRIRAGRQLRFLNTGGGTERSWKDLLWGVLNIVGIPDPSGAPRLSSFGYATKALDADLA